MRETPALTLICSIKIQTRLIVRNTTSPRKKLARLRLQTMNLKVPMYSFYVAFAWLVCTPSLARIGGLRRILSLIVSRRNDVLGFGDYHKHDPQYCPAEVDAEM